MEVCRTETTRDQFEPAFRAPRWLLMASVAAVIIGLAGILLAARTSPLQVWVWLIVNFVLFGGIARGMLLWSSAFRIAQARWTPAVNRLGHSAIAFIPVSYLAMIVLLIGLRGYMPWVIHPVPAKAGWLNVPFMTLRDLILMLVLFVVSLVMVRWTLKADDRARRGETIDRAAHYRLTAISIAAAIAYVLAETILAYDFIMSLSPEWYSTMFAPYIWVTDMYVALAVLIMMATMLRGSASSYLGPPEVQNLANLTLAFSLLSMGLFFAQYLTIWYGNLPDETGFMIVRYYRGHWPWLGWTGFVTAYGIPFVLLQSRWIKTRPAWASAVSALIVIGVGLERYVLVAPSIIPGDPMFILMPVLSILGFLGAFVLAVSLFLRRYSPISAADVALCDTDEEVDRRMVAEL